MIPDEATAIKVAEAILFRVYSEQKIKTERPYRVVSDKEFWTIEGSVPKGSAGGAFIIRIARKDGQVLHLGHFK